MHHLRSLASFVLTAAIITVTASARAEGLPPPLPSASEAPVADPPAAGKPGETPAPGPPATAATSSLKLTYEATRVDRPGREAAPARSPDDYTLLHGFRLGYGYVMNYDRPTEAFEGKSLQEKVGLRSPHHFLLGYEVVYRVVGHAWLNVLLLGNAMVAGLEQSKVLPSANLLIGAELKNTFQIGVGANLSPLKGSEGHTIIAAGWTPRVGSIYTPVHFFFIPDVDGNHRMGITTGVTF